MSLKQLKKRVWASWSWRTRTRYIIGVIWWKINPWSWEHKHNREIKRRIKEWKEKQTDTLTK